MKTTKGFTLIELLVVITIIGILATGASAVYSSAQAKARDAVRQSDLSVIRSGIELSQTESATGLYPQYDTFPNFTSDTSVFLQSVPLDPAGVAYTYHTDVLSSVGGGASTAEYVLATTLDDGTAYAVGTDTTLVAPLPSVTLNLQ